MIAWLKEGENFPPVASALIEPNGLLCASENLSASLLLDAYIQGIFPWFSEGEPVLWWSPNPRTVLFLDEFKCSRSLTRVLKNAHYQVVLNAHFAKVIHECASSARKNQNGTWIDAQIKQSYGALFQAGFAHCVETWIDQKLVGGLYGVAIGNMFYGESMFSLVDNASKIAFAHLVYFLKKQGFTLIDCQVYTAHLASLGAREIARDEFLTHVRKETAKAPIKPNWQAGEFLSWREAIK